MRAIEDAESCVLKPRTQATSPSNPNSGTDVPVPTGSDSRTCTWLQAAVSFPAVLTLVLLALVFVIARTRAGDPDIWWHLRNAEYLVQQHHLPSKDTYSFTVPGHFWVSHEWLAELPFYFAWRAFGLSGVMSLTLALLFLIFLGTLYLCWKETGHFKASVVACYFLVFLATVSFGPRTILFGYLFIVTLLIILQRFRLHGHAPLWVLPPLFCLWINFHGTWSLGLVLFGIVVAAGLVEGTWGGIYSVRWTPKQLRQLVLTGLLSMAALFVNPYGWRLVMYPLDLAFRQKLNSAYIAEWVSVDFHQLRGKIVLAFLALLLLGALLRRARLALAELGLLLFAVYSGLTYSRFLFLLSIVAAPSVARILEFVPVYRREDDTPRVNAVVILLIVAGMAFYWPTSAQSEQAVAQAFPVKAVPLLHNKPAEPMLNLYMWGGYLTWQSRDAKIFIDGRADIFEYQGVLRDYLDLLDLKRPKELLDKYHIQSVLFPPDEPLTYVLQHDPEWRTVYSDSVCVLLERANTLTANGAAQSGR
jgi:hypothetical protein